VALVALMCLASVVWVAVLHWRQEVGYWQQLEGLVRQERAARVQATQEALLLRDRAQEQVLHLQKDLAKVTQQRDLTTRDVQGSDRACPTCPNLPSPSPPLHCPPSASSASSTLALASDSVPLEEWRPDYKIYVYDLPAEFNSDLKRDQRRCINDQYGTEIMFHENILKHEVRTLDPLEAEFFLVPLYGECFLFRENQRAGKEALKITNKWFRRALQIVTQEHPHWNRTQGRDHVFVFAGARGPHIFQDWKKHIKKSIFLTPEGDRSLSEQFNTWKDVVIPGLENEPSFTSGSNREKYSASQRNIFAFFRGTIHNKGGASYSRGLRIKMEAQLRDKKDVVFSEQTPDCDRKCYRDSMARSVFCVCPRGWSPWTLRAYQAMMSGCIPVIIADEIEFPYENAIDWRELTIKISEVNAERTYEILKSISNETIHKKREAVDRVWRMVAWQTPTIHGDAFHSTLRELGRKRRNFKASSYVFWT